MAAALLQAAAARESTDAAANQPVNCTQDGCEQRGEDPVRWRERAQSYRPGRSPRDRPANRYVGNPHHHAKRYAAQKPTFEQRRTPARCRARQNQRRCTSRESQAPTDATDASASNAITDNDESAKNLKACKKVPVRPYA